MVNFVTQQLCYSRNRFCLGEQDSFPVHDIQKYWLAYHSTSSKSTKGNHIERIKPPNSNIQKPRSTYQLHTWRQWVCMHKRWYWFYPPWHCSSKHSHTRDLAVQPNHQGACSNFITWPTIQKTTDIICTAPDDACCTFSKYFPMETWIINWAVSGNYNDRFSSPWLKQTQVWIRFLCTSFWCTQSLKFHLEQQEMQAELSVFYLWLLVMLFGDINGLSALSRRRLSEGLRPYQSRISSHLFSQQD